MVRPPHFSSRLTQHLLRVAPTALSSPSGPPATSGQHQIFQCWRVPHHAQREHWTSILGSPHLTHELLLSPQDSSTVAQDPAGLAAHVTRVLSKFEDPAFLHLHLVHRQEGPQPGSDTSTASQTAADPQQHVPAKRQRRLELLKQLGEKLTIKRGRSQAPASAESAPSQPGHETEPEPPAVLSWELPRYGLEFELRGSTLVSCNYQGYELCGCQQLWLGEGQYTLPGLEQYLVLQRTAAGQGSPTPQGAQTVILVPAGPVTVDRAKAAGTVQIQLPK